MGLEEKAEERPIDGTTYRCWPLPWGTARPLLVRVLKIISPLMDGDIATLASSLTDADLEVFGKAFGNASSYTDGDRQPLLTDSMQQLHFAGRPDVFLAWVAFAMEVNGFARFFTGAPMKDLVARVQGAMKASVPALPTSLP